MEFEVYLIDIGPDLFEVMIQPSQLNKKEIQISPPNYSTYISSI